MLAASKPAFVPPEVSRGGGTAIPAWLCPLDTVLAIHRSRTSLGDGRTRARGSSLTSSPRGQRPRPQVSGGAARGAAGRRRLRRRAAAGPGRLPALRAPLPACGLSATLSNCRLWGRRGAAVGRAEESWVPATAASGSPGRSRGERAHTGPPPLRANSRGRTWSLRRLRPLQGPDSRAGSGLRPGASRALRPPPPASSGRPGPGPTSARPAQPPAVSPTPGPAALQAACPAVTLRARRFRRSPPAPGKQTAVRPSPPAGAPSGRPPISPALGPPSSPRAAPVLTGLGGGRVLPSSGSRCRQNARFLRQPRIPAAALRPGPASPARPRPRRARRLSAALGTAVRPGRGGHGRPPRVGGARAAAKRSARLRSPQLSRGAPRARAFPGAGARRPGPAGAARSAAGGAPAAA